MNGEAFARARTAFAHHDYIDALTILNDLIGQATDSAPMALLGETLEKLGLTAEAAEAFEQAAGHGDDSAPLFLRRAAELHAAAGNVDRAQLAGMTALGHLPDDPRLAFLLARLFQATGETELLDLVKTTLVASDDPDHLAFAGTLFAEDERNPATLTLFAKLADLHPDDPYTQFKYMAVARDFCDYAALERLESKLAADIAGGRVAVIEGETGYSNLLHCGDERLNRLASNNLNLTQRLSPGQSRQRRAKPHVWSTKIRIGYLSGDFWDDHATMRLFQSVLEAHDPARFEVTLYCHTPARFVGFDGGNRQKWGRIVSLGDQSDAVAADTIRRQGVDILIDLKGHTGGSRANILNQMVAPVQVAWLGFPGSTVNIDCDYVIGDTIVLPNSSRPFYHEKFCRLPECYQPNDPIYRALPVAAKRADLGLPEDAFVLAAFNTARKISPATLDLWAAVLRGADCALLWLMLDGAVPRANMWRALEKRGVGADRIVFAQKTGYEQHIARLQAADLGLDTFPYNGHTTTSDKLWAGLPVLTKKGTNFASRVSESLLHAMGLPELVARDDAGFVAMATGLARDRDGVAVLKRTIAENRFVAPLFDAERFCRHLEHGYEAMIDKARLGLPPDHIDVAARPARNTAFHRR